MANDHYYTQDPASAHDVRTFSFAFEGRTLSFATDAGVFSKGHVDPGTLLLARSLPADLAGRALDLGCGWGALSVLTLCRFPQLKLVMSDVNRRALDLAQQNVRANGMAAQAVLSDGLQAVRGMFDVVLTNPPIRAGKQVIYAMFADSRARLNPGGRLILVIRKQQGAPSAQKYLSTLFGQVELLARDAGYWILCCTA